MPTLHGLIAIRVNAAVGHKITRVELTFGE